MRSVALALLLSMAGLAQAEEPVLPDLSLEELLATDVVTASRKAQRMHDVAAAAFVVTREDIQRSGALSIPDALRLVPGVEVAQIGSNRWAVTARGFNGRFANKLLVLLDGRSIYAGLFSGVMWGREDTLLEDIDRIEVIRGPGAAMWGSNAVNGVINIITRRAHDTQGTVAIAGGGNIDRAFGALRHGGTIGDGHYRAWAKAYDRAPGVDANGNEGNDPARSYQAGFRADLPLARTGRLTVSGGAFRTRNQDLIALPDLLSPTGAVDTIVDQSDDGGHLLARYEWENAGGSQSTLQAYAEAGTLTFSGVAREERATFDVDYQQRQQIGSSHDVVWGIGYRHYRSRADGLRWVDVAHGDSSQSLASAFAQDEITLVPNRLRTILGARFEHNSRTGWEPQPNVRLIYTPTRTQSLWAAASRAARLPSRIEYDGSLELFVQPATAVTPPVVGRYSMESGHALGVEHVKTYEIGYRHLVDTTLSFDVVGFHSDYRELRGGITGEAVFVPTPVPHVVQLLYGANNVGARTRGVEVAADWQPLPYWRLQAAYTYLDVEARTTAEDPLVPLLASYTTQTSPRHRASLRSAFNLPNRQQLDVVLRHVGRIDQVDITTRAERPVPAYTTLDLRYAWRVTPSFEFALVGRNLLAARHAEFGPDYFTSQPLEIARSFVVRAKWLF